MVTRQTQNQARYELFTVVVFCASNLTAEKRLFGN